MQFSMINQFALIFVDGFIIYYICRALLKALQNKSKKQQILSIGLVAVIIMVSHYKFFTRVVKEDNYLQFFRIERAYSSDVLNKKMRQVLSMYHPDKNPNSDLNQFNQVTNMRYILSDHIYQKLYDRFGEFTFVEQTKQKDYPSIKASLTLGAYINSISFYSVFFIISIVLSYGQRFSKYRILSAFLLLGLLVQDFMFYGEIEDEYSEGLKMGQRGQKFEVARDLYDDYFPDYTIFERLLLIKIMCSAFLTSLRLYFDCLVKEPVNEYEEKVDTKINQIHDKLLKQFQSFTAPPPPPPQAQQQDQNGQAKSEVNPAAQPDQANQQPRILPLQEFMSNKEDLQDLQTLALKQQQGNPKEKFVWLKKLFKFCLFMLFLYSVVSHILNDGSDDNIQSQNRQQQQKQQQWNQQRQQQQNVYEDDIY